MSAPEFWTNQEKAKETIAELKTAKGIAGPFAKLRQDQEDLAIFLDMAVEAADDATLREVDGKTKLLVQDLARFELRTLFRKDTDALNAYVTVHAGAGGTEACDWAGILLR